MLCTPSMIFQVFTLIGGVHKKHVTIRRAKCILSLSKRVLQVRWESRMTFISVHSRFDLTAICEKEVLRFSPEKLISEKEVLRFSPGKLIS